MNIAVAAALLAAAAPVASVSVDYAQLTIRQRVIIRVPTARAPKQTEWREKKGPRCIPASKLAGAEVSGADSVDLRLRGGDHLRARLKDDCPFLGYYSGFYLRPGSDGDICADRDALHTRAGGRCEIDDFRNLVPKRSGKRAKP